MASKLATMSPKTPQEMEDFAIALGSQTRKFSNHVCYKDFVLDLVKDLTSDYTQAQLTELGTFVERLASTRAKEEKSGNVNHFIQGTFENEEEDDDDGDLDQYADFM